MHHSSLGAQQAGAQQMAKSLVLAVFLEKS